MKNPTPTYESYPTVAPMLGLDAVEVAALRAKIRTILDAAERKAAR